MSKIAAKADGCSVKTMIEFNTFLYSVFHDTIFTRHNGINADSVFKAGTKLCLPAVCEP